MVYRIFIKPPNLCTKAARTLVQMCCKIQFFNEVFRWKFQRTFEMADSRGARDQRAPITAQLPKWWSNETVCKSHETSLIKLTCRGRVASFANGSLSQSSENGMKFRIVLKTLKGEKEGKGLTWPHCARISHSMPWPGLYEACWGFRITEFRVFLKIYKIRIWIIYKIYSGLWIIQTP